MALKEYKPGTTFPGRMGRTIGESEPAWPSPLRAKEGAPNVLFIVIDDTGFGQLGCFGSPISDAEHRQARQERSPVQQHAHDGALFAVALVHPDRAQPSLERDVVHHRGIDRLSRRQWRDTLRERLSVGDAAAAGLRDLCHRQMAPDASPSRSARPVLMTAGRWGAASSAITGFSAATPINIIPTSSTTIIRSSRRRRRKRAITSPPISPTRRSTSSPT